MIERNQSDSSGQSNVSWLSRTSSEISIRHESSKMPGDFQVSNAIIEYVSNESLKTLMPKDSGNEEFNTNKQWISNYEIATEDVQTIYSQSRETIPNACIDLGLICTTPYSRKNYHYYYNEIALLSEACSFKQNCLNSIESSESFQEDFKENIEDRLMKRYISKTLTGWDERGMHYWLHKVNSSNLRLPIIEEIISDSQSWYHIHFCETCITRLNMSEYYLHHPDIYQAKIAESEVVLYETSFSDKGTTDSTTTYQLPCSTYFDSSSAELDNANDYQQPLCSDQYVSRVVYSYNTCALNCELFDKNKKENTLKRYLPKYEKNIPNKDTLLDESSLNPSIKIVVYGTDPCGLNFPVDLSGKESGDNKLVALNDAINACSGTVCKDVNSCTSIQNDKLDSEVKNSTTFDSNNDSSAYCTFSCQTLETDSSKTCTYSSLITGKSASFVVSSVENNSEFSVMQSSFSANGSITTVGSTGYTESQSSLFSKTDSDVSSSCTIGSLNSYVNMNVQYSGASVLQLPQEKMPFLKDMFSNKLFPSGYSADGESCSLQEMPSNTYMRKRMPYRARMSYSQRFARVSKNSARRQYYPNILRLSNSTVKKIKSIYLGGKYGKIVFSQNSNSNDKIFSEMHKKYNFPQDQSKVPMQIVMYLSFVLFFVFCYILLEDSVRRYHLFEPSRKWYLP